MVPEPQDDVAGERLPKPASMAELAALFPFETVATQAAIEFIDPPDDLDFDRPFLHMAMEGLKKLDTAKELAKATLTFAELRALVGDRTPDTSGMVFHVGRCGSTLVSRMIGHDRSRLVLREASVIGGLHRESGGMGGASTFAIEQAMKDTLCCYDAFAETRGQRGVVKHSSWESFTIGRLAELLPETPIVFVYRDPIETIESSLDGHPGWAPRLHAPRAQLQRWVPWLDRVEQPFNAVDVYAGVWAAGAHAALSAPSDRVLLVDYADLTADPARTLDQLCRHLHLDLDPDKALAELGQYSKSKTDGESFDKAGKHGHPKLTARSKAQLRDVVGDLRDRLAERAAEQR